MLQVIVGFSWIISLKKVVLPLAFSPISATLSPALIENAFASNSVFPAISKVASFALNIVLPFFISRLSGVTILIGFVVRGFSTLPSRSIRFSSALIVLCCFFCCVPFPALKALASLLFSRFPGFTIRPASIS